MANINELKAERCELIMRLNELYRRKQFSRADYYDEDIVFSEARLQEVDDLIRKEIG